MSDTEQTPLGESETEWLNRLAREIAGGVSRRQAFAVLQTVLDYGKSVPRPEGADEIERLRSENAELLEDAERRTVYLKPNPEIIAERDALLEIIREVANSTVEYEARKYLVVQMDKATMRAAIDAARGKG